MVHRLEMFGQIIPSTDLGVASWSGTHECGDGIVDLGGFQVTLQVRETSDGAECLWT